MLTCSISNADLFDIECWPVQYRILTYLIVGEMLTCASKCWPVRYWMLICCLIMDKCWPEQENADLFDIRVFECWPKPYRLNADLLHIECWHSLDACRLYKADLSILCWPPCTHECRRRRREVGMFESGKCKRNWRPPDLLKNPNSIGHALRLVYP